MPRIRAMRTMRRSSTTIKQPYRILVGSCGEPSSLGAIRVALALARRRSASVHTLAVTPPFPHQIPSVANIAPPALVDEDNRRTALEVLRRQLVPVRGTRDWTIRATVGWPADSITGSAERWPASLIMVGIGEHGIADRLIGSETAVRIARRSRVPVLAVPQDAVDLPTRGVAAIDFTESSVDAAMLAATLLGPNGTLTLLHASMLVKGGSEPGSLPDLYTAGVREKLVALRDRVHRRTRRQIRTELMDGDIVSQLVDYADREACDLIALGSHEQTLVDRLLIGSVRTRILRHVHCAVLIAPHERVGE